MQQQHERVKVEQHLIEEAFTFSEYISMIKRPISEQDYKLLKPLSSLQPNSQQLKSLTPFNYRQLAIQFYYLLYSCWHNRIVPVPEDDEKFLVYSYENTGVCLCLSDFVYFEDSVIKDYETATPYFEYYKNFIKAIHPYWKQCEQQGEKQSKREYLSADYYLKKLLQLIETKQLQSERQAFSTFQKQQIFIETSILLRINRSALVCLVRKSQQLVELYRKHRQLEDQLSEEYNERRKRKNNIQKVLETQKNIQKNIEDFFLAMHKNPQYYKIEDRRRKQTNGYSFTSSKLLIGLKVFQHSNQSTDYDPNFYNSFEIEYHSMKNILIVRMVTDIVLDWASSDSILFKWNTLTFQTSNVGLETIQKLDEQKKTKKFIVIRGTSHFNKKEPVLQKILTLIDITMATYKSIQLEMKSENFFNKNINKIDESYKKINHYLKAIHKCSQRTYSAIVINKQV